MKCNKCGYENNDKAKFSNISKKKKIIIGVLLMIVLIGCIGGYLHYDNYKYQTGYNLTEDKKLSNINKQLTKNNYEGAETLVDNYFADNLDLRDFYIIRIKLCQVNQITSLNDLTEEQKRISINEQLAKHNYDEAISLLDSYFPNNSGYLNKVKMCRDKNFSSLDGAEQLIEKNDRETKREEKEAKDKQDAEYKEKADIANEILRKNEEEIRKTKGVSIGMTKSEVLASSWGKPKDINKTTTKYGTNEQWVYSGNRYLYFDNGILTSIQN
ncbi:hypothetical protein psyc5s11_36800 [Clostridium gelidum]|uniref:Lipoprotein n=1 Tax=Clostridium gelidum TaxID=704125 RepID=A0ABM7T6J4_9CLOT|nr:DUF2845 domain-containing protein [Clostridium gelidum]BCZ47613.1 hypothetical protein psyc5s11_36800 [Clostridium gelidum]